MTSASPACASTERQALQQIMPSACRLVSVGGGSRRDQKAGPDPAQVILNLLNHLQQADLEPQPLDAAAGLQQLDP